MRGANYEADWILHESYDTFYAASDDNICPTIDLTLREAVEFDTFAIGEKVEYGIRINAYRVEAIVNGEWTVLADKKSIGFLWTERFARVKTDRVRIIIYGAVAAPVIRTFGLYKMPDAYYEILQAEKEQLKKAVNLTILPNAKIIEEENGVKVEFGGIYPFNTICFNGQGIWDYEILAFDGADYFEVCRGHKPAEQEIVKLPEEIRYSYQMKLITNKSDNANLQIEVLQM